MNRFIRSFSTLNKFSKIITQNKQSGAAQAMLYALDLKKDDLDKPQIGIGSVWFESNPCNSKLNELTYCIKKSFKNGELLPFRFSSPGVSDGISMGTDGMKYSLPSRELIADNFESITMAHYYDGLICVPGCDKNLPGVLIAMCRVNRPSFIIYGGSMPPSNVNNEETDIVTAFESYGSYLGGNINENEYENIIQNCCNKQCGSCSGLYTANTMASILEVMGLTLPNSSSNPSMSVHKLNECNESYKIMNNLIKNDIKPSDILTKEAFYNGIKMLYCTGGSTNAIIHLMAIADSIGVNITLDDFNNFSNIPILLNMKPHGDYMMYHLHKIGGTAYFINYLIDSGIINGDCLTITGKTLKENVNNVVNKDKYKIKNFKDQKIICDINNPFKKNSHIKILKGNISKNGCITKIYSDEKYFEGSILVYDSEEEMIKSLNKGEIGLDNFIIIRGQGETVGCPEMLKPTSALVGYFGSKTPPLATDGRFSGGSKGILIAHLDDMYKDGSLTGIIKNGDKISIDLEKNNISLYLNNDEINKRLIISNILKPKFKGTLHKFSKYVGDINNGYVIR